MVFQIQYVIRPKTEAFHDYRGFAGNVRSGVFSVGDAISIHPSGSLKSGIRQLQALLIGIRHKDRGKGPDKETRAKAQGTRTKGTKAARDQGSREPQH